MARTAAQQSLANFLKACQQAAPLLDTIRVAADPVDAWVSDALTSARQALGLPGCEGARAQGNGQYFSGNQYSFPALDSDFR